MNVTSETIKLLEEYTGSKLLDIGLGDDFFQSDTKSNNKQMGLHRTKNFHTAKKTISKMNRQPTKWEKIFVNHISDKGLIIKIYKELTQLNSKQNKKPPKQSN